MAKSKSLGFLLADRLRKAQVKYEQIPRGDVPNRPVIKWTKSGEAVGYENKVDEVTDVIAKSEKVYTYGNSVVEEVIDGEGRSLQLLATMDGVVDSAGYRLGHIFLISVQKGLKWVQLPPTKANACCLLYRPETLRRLPRIRIYAHRPLFDDKYKWCRSGWHPESGILVHGPDVALGQPSSLPQRTDDADATEVTRVLSGLPPFLRQLLSDFPFSSGADVANTVAMLVTGLLMPQFTKLGHPLVVLDGNQPGIGKTYLAFIYGKIMDGAAAPTIPYISNDEELAKQILALIIDGRHTSIIIDNAKTKGGDRISSVVLESYSVAGHLSMRILGHSKTYERQNDLMWFLTMNGTRLSPDLTRRQLPIRFWYDGDPQKRRFQGRDPLTFAETNRIPILQELGHMVLRWIAEGSPVRERDHRIPSWANPMAGIMEVNGLPEFLTNLKEASDEFNADSDDVLAIAVAALEMRKCYFTLQEQDGTVPTDSARDAKIKEYGKRPCDWVDVLKKAEQPVDASPASVGRALSQKFSSFVGEELRVTHKGKEVVMVLRKGPGRSNQTLYCFELVQGNIDPAPIESAAARPEAGSAIRYTTRPDRQVVAVEGRVQAKPAGSCAGNDEDW